MKIVYIDLDGVLFDLHAALVDFTGIPFPENDRDSLFKQHLPNFVRDNGFEKLPALENAHKLVQGLREFNTAILTSGGSFYRPRAEVIRQKKGAVDSTFPSLEQIPFCATSSGAQKSHLANKKAFLIDDWAPNIEKFVEAGGYGVVYHPSEIDSVLAQVRRFYSV